MSTRLTLLAHAVPAGPALLLGGFDAMPPALAALAAARPAPSLEFCAPGPPHGTPRVLRAADSGAQLELIAQWCVLRLQAQADARLLVVLPGRGGDRTRLAALIGGALDAAHSLGAVGEARLPVAIEGGESFAELPLPRTGLLGLALLGGEDMEVEAVGEWLRAPFWEHPSAPRRAALAQLVKERTGAAPGLHGLLGALQLVPPELKPAARELDGLLRRAAGALGEGSASTRRWSERCAAALAALGWPGEAALLQPRLRETGNRFHELLEEFGELSLSIGSLQRREALSLLRALARRTAYRPADEDVAVTLSPMLADPVIGYDGIWVANLTADTLPQPLAPDPFLPLSAQIAAGVPQASTTARRVQALTLLAPGAPRRPISCCRCRRARAIWSCCRARSWRVFPSPLRGRCRCGYRRGWRARD